MPKKYIIYKKMSFTYCLLGCGKKRINPAISYLHCHHDRKHWSMQADKVLEKLRVLHLDPKSTGRESEPLDPP